KLIDWTANHYIDYLVLAQDDAAEYGLHRAESELLDEKVNKLNIEDKVSIFPGTDEVDVVLLARFATKVYNESPTFYIEYSGIHGKNWVAPFEDTSFDQNVIKHITAAGAKITTDEKNADVNLILNTPSTIKENREKDLLNTV